MDKRVFLAIIISIAVLFLYPYILKRLYPPPAEIKPRVDRSVIAEKAAPAEVGIKARAPGGPEPIVTIKEELTTVETPLYRAVFTSLGGGLTSWELKKYSESQTEPAGVVDLAKIIGKDTPFRTGLVKDSTAAPVAFSPSAVKITLAGSELGELVFTGATAEGGIVLEKRLSFDASGYTVDTRLIIRNTTKEPFEGFVETGLAAGFKGDEKAYYHSGPLVKTG